MIQPRRTTFRSAGASAIVFSCAFTVAASAQAGRWGTPDDPTVKTIRAAEETWAASNCGPQPTLASIIAEDFQGTATDGRRTRKADAIETDPRALDRDCRLGDVKVQFFGESVAVAYGNESSIRKGKDGQEQKRCLVWTDTWLKRNGQWQIIAAQDTHVPCT